LKARFKGNGVDSKAKIAGEMLNTIAKVPNAVSRSEYVKRLSQNLDVDPEALWIEIKKVRPDQRPSFDLGVTQTAETAKPVCLHVAEKMLLGLALDDHDFISHIRRHFKENQVREGNDFNVLLEAVCDFWNEHKTINMAKLINSTKNESHSKTMLDAYASVENIQDKDKCLKDCVKNIKQAQIKEKMKMLQQEIKTAQDTKKDSGYQAKLLSEYNDLIRQKVEVCPR